MPTKLMNWLEFKSHVERQGLRDCDIVQFIDWSDDYGCQPLVARTSIDAVYIVEQRIEDK